MIAINAHALTREDVAALDRFARRRTRAARAAVVALLEEVATEGREEIAALAPAQLEHLARAARAQAAVWGRFKPSTAAPRRPRRGGNG